MPRVHECTVTHVLANADADLCGSESDYVDTDSGSLCTEMDTDEIETDSEIITIEEFVFEQVHVQDTLYHSV